MEYNVDEKKIIINKEINKLDKFVFDFVSLLGEKYVIVSGYVSILTGRSRATEDVDLLIPETDFQEFLDLWKRIYAKDFECLNTENPKNAFDSLKEYAIRFSRKEKPIPNIEFKMIKNDIEKYSFKNKIKVSINGKEMNISPIEIQIAFKLMLGKEGNEKDIEDAKHLYELFREKINKQELLNLIKQFKVEKEFELIK